MLKKFEVEWDSQEDCYKLYEKIRSRVFEFKKLNDPNHLSKKDKFLKIFNSCMNVYNTDISKVYNNLKLDETPRYYVYAHCDPGFKIAIKKEGRSSFAATLGMEYMPFYIGKGTDNRAYDLNRNETHRKVRQKINSFNREIKVKIIKDNLTEKEALMLESKLIDIFGLVSYKGRLVNLDEGINNTERRKLYEEDLKELSNYYKNSVIKSK